MTETLAHLTALWHLHTEPHLRRTLLAYAQEIGRLAQARYDHALCEAIDEWLQGRSA